MEPSDIAAVVAIIVTLLLFVVERVIDGCNRSVAENEEMKRRLNQLLDSEHFRFFRLLLNTESYGEMLEVPNDVLQRRGLSTMPCDLNAQINREALEFMGCSGRYPELDRWTTLQKAQQNVQKKQFASDVQNSTFMMQSYSACFVRALASGDSKWGLSYPPSSQVLVYRTIISSVFNQLVDELPNKGVKEYISHHARWLDFLSLFLKPIRLTIPTGDNIIPENLQNKEDMLEFADKKKAERDKNRTTRIKDYNLFMVYLWRDWINEQPGGQEFKKFLKYLDEVHKTGRRDKLAWRWTIEEPTPHILQARHVACELSTFSFLIDHEADWKKNRGYVIEDPDIWWDADSWKLFREKQIIRDQRKHQQDRGQNVGNLPLTAETLHRVRVDLSDGRR